MNKSNQASVSAERIRNIFADHFCGVRKFPGNGMFWFEGKDIIVKQQFSRKINNIRFEI